MEYLILGFLVGIILLFGTKIKDWFFVKKDLKLVKQDKQLEAETKVLSDDIKQLNKKIDTAYNPNMTPEEIVEFWRGKK